MFYSFEHKKFFTCNNIKYNDKGIAIGISGYNKDETSGKVQRVTIEESESKYRKFIKELKNDTRNLLSVYDTTNGFIFN